MKLRFVTTAAVLFLAHAACAELLTFTFAVTNNTGSAATYDVSDSKSFTLNTTESQIQGSVTLNVIDMGYDGATLSSAGDPVYRAYIDGTEASSLFDDPYSLPAPALGGDTDSTQFGWETYGNGVVNDISIALKFTLSPGDSALVTSTFEVIPEPASLILIGIASSAIMFVRRRFIA